MTLDVLLLLQKKKRIRDESRGVRRLFAGTHLPRFFVAVMSEVQLVCCYDLVASVVVVIRIYGGSDETYSDGYDLNLQHSLQFKGSVHLNHHSNSGVFGGGGADVRWSSRRSMSKYPWTRH